MGNKPKGRIKTPETIRKTFEDIPQPAKARPVVPEELIKKALLHTELQALREQKQKEANELRKEIYNISMKITSIDTDMRNFILDCAKA